MIRILKEKKFLLLIWILILIVFQAGCAFKDVDNRAFVVAISIDPSEDEEDKFKITLKIAIPSGSFKESSSPEYTYLSYEGETLGEAIQMLQTNIDKTIELGHAKVIIINEKLLSKDVRRTMDFFSRSGDIQLITWIAAAKPSAEAVLKTEPTAEAVTSVALFNYFDKSGTESPYITTTFLFALGRNILGEGIDAVVPLIEIDKDEELLIVNKSLIVKDKHKPFELTSLQTKYYNSFVHGEPGFHANVKHEDMTFFLDIDTVKMNYKVIIEKDKPSRIAVNVSMIGVIQESNKTLKWENLEEYSEYANIELKKEVLALLTSVQEENLDPFGFGLRYRATRLNDKNTIKEWNSIYPNIKFDVNMDVKLKSTGAIQ